jgi:hypothetical protein
VVDGGLVKVARYDAERGIDHLVTERITLDSADQRAGRAARLGPGLARRLWDARDRLRPTREPDIARVDLAAPVLDLLVWGANPWTFEWFETPRDERLEHALEVLARLGAVEGPTRAPAVTTLGRQLQRLPVHPRLARILVEGDGGFDVAAACALLSEGRTFAGSAATTSCDLLADLDRFSTQPPIAALAVSCSARPGERREGHNHGPRARCGCGARSLPASRTAWPAAGQPAPTASCWPPAMAPHSGASRACARANSWSRSTSPPRRDGVAEARANGSAVDATDCPRLPRRRIASTRQRTRESARSRAGALVLSERRSLPTVAAAAPAGGRLAATPREADAGPETSGAAGPEVVPALVRDAALPSRPCATSTRRHLPLTCARSSTSGAREPAGAERAARSLTYADDGSVVASVSCRASASPDPHARGAAGACHLQPARPEWTCGSDNRDPRSLAGAFQEVTNCAAAIETLARTDRRAHPSPRGSERRRPR